ncbi:FAD dependent oxidoreductase (plasmid) [Aminobacter aminovorans]|uniref:FAD dependent oxidoreductase n=2 Tax=Aminobacter aminovorans TaxID=83263 RepID=A0AAC8YVQ0_AMIAI|nr:FAD dependent oxidoreductase [Aminobacter aminovorans]
MLQCKMSEPDSVVVGGGIVGASIAFGLARTGERVVLLDEGDVAFRASRGNFALVWVQSKGLGLPPYAAWTQRSAGEWHELARILQDETGIDVAHSQPGGFTLCLSQKEVDARLAKLEQFHNLPGVAHFPYEILDHDEVKKRLPEIGSKVVGAVYSPLDGHANPLLLMRALHSYLATKGGEYRPAHAVHTIDRQTDGFRLRGTWGELRTAKLILAAGLGNVHLAPMVGLEAPVKPSRGQLIVTEKTAPFLHNPMVTIRQTNEGGVLIGDSKEEAGFENVTGTGVLSVMAQRAIDMFPRLRHLNVVRTWSALRVMSPDGFPIYDQTSSGPPAFVTSCHSGVTLAGVHAMTLGPALSKSARLPEVLAAFSPKRFHVPAHQ